MEQPSACFEPPLPFGAQGEELEAWWDGQERTFPRESTAHIPQDITGTPSPGFMGPGFGRILPPLTTVDRVFVLPRTQCRFCLFQPRSAPSQGFSGLFPAREAPKILLLLGWSYKSSHFGPITAPLMPLRKLLSSLRLGAAAGLRGRAHTKFLGARGWLLQRSGTWAGFFLCFYTQSPSARLAWGAQRRPHRPSSTPTRTGRWCS